MEHRLILAAVEVVIEPPGTPWWVPWLSVASAISLFVVGFLAGPWGKAREALFLEQRHTRRHLQAVAQDIMVSLAARDHRYDPQHTKHFAHGVLRFQEQLKEHEYKLSEVDRAVCVKFNQAIHTVGSSGNEDEFAQRLNDMYDQYLDVRQPARRWRRRRATRRWFFREVERASFAPAQRNADLVDAPGPDV
jgi:hypothetical protein